jgi:hypothetical protein
VVIRKRSVNESQPGTYSVHRWGNPKWFTVHPDSEITCKRPDASEKYYWLREFGLMDDGTPLDWFNSHKGHRPFGYAWYQDENNWVSGREQLAGFP